MTFLNRRRKPRTGEEVCRCTAYPFPHRKGSADCALLADIRAAEADRTEQFYQSKGLMTSYSRAEYEAGHSGKDFE